MKKSLLVTTIVFVLIMSWSGVYAKKSYPFENNTQRTTVDSVIDSSCLARAVLSGSYSGYRLTRCSFEANVTASAMPGYTILGYDWVLPGESAFFSTSTSEPFSLSNNTSYYFTVKIYARDTTTLDTCTIITLTRTATCESGSGFVSRLAGAQLSVPSVSPLAANDLEFYPNPSCDKLQISSGSNTISTVKVYNLQGQKVGEFNFANTSTAIISLAELPAGNYLVRVNDQTGKIITKVAN